MENAFYKVTSYDLALGKMWYVVDKSLNLAVKMTLSEEEAVAEFNRLSKAKAA